MKTVLKTAGFISRLRGVPFVIRYLAIKRFLGWAKESASLSEGSRKAACFLKSFISSECDPTFSNDGAEQLLEAFIDVARQKADEPKRFEVPKHEELLANVLIRQDIRNELKLTIAVRLNVWHFVRNGSLPPEQRRRSIAYPIIDALHPFTDRVSIPFSCYADLAEKAIELSLQAVASKQLNDAEVEAYYLSIGERVRNLMHAHPILDSLNWTIR